jgi:hypothetical protein
MLSDNLWLRTQHTPRLPQAQEIPDLPLPLSRFSQMLWACELSLEAVTFVQVLRFYSLGSLVPPYRSSRDLRYMCGSGNI